MGASPYEILGVERGVSGGEVKARYYELVRSVHPDLVSDPARKRAAEERFKEVVRAYEILRDPSRRQTFDRASSTSGLRRAAWADRRYGANAWQHHADNSFYGFRPPDPAATRPRYTSNARFFGAVFVVTWVVAAFQYQRLAANADRAIQRADRKHLDAAKSLEDAREAARSQEGRLRYEAYKRKAAEQRARGLEPPPGQWGIGHGGPSGKEAYEKRKAELPAQAQLPPPQALIPAPPQQTSSPQ